MNNLRQNIYKYFQQQSELFPDDIFFSERPNRQIRDMPGNKNSLNELHQNLFNCEKCGLAEKCTQKVPGGGNSQAKLMLVGEAPGREEDKKGEPFVGKSGELLDKILTAIDLDREDVFISNIVKCRPPGNRNPHKKEIKDCIDFLKKEIEIVDPDMIVALGLTATKALLGTEGRLKDFRNQTYEYQNRILIPTYHPSALLQNPKYKKPTWEDFKKIKKLYFEEER